MALGNAAQTILANMAKNGATPTELSEMAARLGDPKASAAPKVETSPTAYGQPGYQPKPRTASIVDRKSKDGIAYRVLQTSNGANGKMHRGVDLAIVDVNAVIAFLKSAPGQAFLKTGIL